MGEREVFLHDVMRCLANALPRIIPAQQPLEPIGFAVGRYELFQQSLSRSSTPIPDHVPTWWRTVEHVQQAAAHHRSRIIMIRANLPVGPVLNVAFGLEAESEVTHRTTDTVPPGIDLVTWGFGEIQRLHLAELLTVRSVNGRGPLCRRFDEDVAAGWETPEAVLASAWTNRLQPVVAFTRVA